MDSGSGSSIFCYIPSRIQSGCRVLLKNITAGKN
jgi:hypothetical protein